MLLLSSTTTLAQSTSPAAFVAHYFPINSVSPIGATIAAFRIAPDGAATLVGNYVSGEWTQSLALAPSGRYIASANGTSATTEELRVYRVNADASLTQVHQTTTPDSPLDMVWVSDTVLAVTRTQQGGSFIRTYRWNEMAPSLTLADEKPSGYFNSTVTRHPTGPWIYTQDSGVFGGLPKVQQWRVASDGLLTDLGVAFSLDPPLKPTISPDGRWMFTGTGAYGGNTVSVFSIDPVTGAPVEVSGSPFPSPGDTPYRTATSSDNRFVFVGHTGDDTVRTFSLNHDTGELTATGFSFDAGPRLSLGPMATLDDRLIVIKDSNDPIGLWVFNIGQTGDLTQVGPLYSTGNRRPELAMVTWSPHPACPADINRDGQAGVQDIFDFLAFWFANDPRADFDQSGAVALEDLFAFLGAWFTGCG
jgi:6-phosphogluconolactonase (cycloisomerase 2 family)